MNNSLTPKTTPHNDGNDCFTFKSEEWQGRRQDQVEASYKTFWWCILLTIITTILVILFQGT
jgi:type IV secretory pathway component VirB8